MNNKMMSMFEIYIGHDNAKEERFKQYLIEHICNNFFIGYTLIKTDGLWKGQTEKSYLIKIISSDRKKVIKLKKKLQKELKQDSILVTQHDLKNADF